MFDSIPFCPDAGRYWDMVETHKINIFYTAPTAIRALMAKGNAFVEKYDLSSLKVLGTVGEPINPAAWEWYYNVVGKKNCDIVDTYWQTETGGIVLTPIPGTISTKPGSATLPFYGIQPVLLDEQTGEELVGNNITGVLAIKQPWPSMTRTVFGNHQRYLNAYFRPYEGYYFTGDGAFRDSDGYYWIEGRVDDVISVAGHRLGTAEIESALVLHNDCAESAVIGAPHEIKGQCIIAFCILNADVEGSEELKNELIQQVRTNIGPIATPQAIYYVSGLPKTRSGKIMRRLLRKILANEALGDVSTLAEPSVLDGIKEAVFE
eukprot:TRINITY_DN5201_c0_g2_i2.p2 TRINITY_DN5201_c0_g2~~TRINITY_DN5201_c0_g2_i2.p2  ORF type:complete len:320 (-),score=81.98 TRINITY_DN5201_c0_g2_i2:26-985(-)